jgi:hypothetical protein
MTATSEFLSSPKEFAKIVPIEIEDEEDDENEID